jgi:hypothetical protein
MLSGSPISKSSVRGGLWYGLAVHIFATSNIKQYQRFSTLMGGHLIRNYGFLAKGERSFNLARVRALIERQTGHEPAEDEKTAADGEPGTEALRESFAACPDCRGLMRRVATVPAASAFHCNTS